MSAPWRRQDNSAEMQDIVFTNYRIWQVLEPSSLNHNVRNKHRRSLTASLQCLSFVPILSQINPYRVFLSYWTQWLRIGGSKGSTMLGNSLSEDGGTVGCRNIVILKFRLWTKSPLSPKKQILCQWVIQNRLSPTALNIYIITYKGKVIPLQARCGPEGG